MDKPPAISQAVADDPAYTIGDSFESQIRLLMFRRDAEISRLDGALGASYTSMGRAHNMIWGAIRKAEKEVYTQEEAYAEFVEELKKISHFLDGDIYTGSHWMEY